MNCSCIDRYEKLEKPSSNCSDTLFNNPNYQIISTIVIFALVLLSLCLAYIVWRYRKMYLSLVQQQTVDLFFNDNPTCSKKSKNNLKRLDYIILKEDYPKYDKAMKEKYEISNYTLEKETLGTGLFGIVHAGSVYKENPEEIIKVAVKQPNFVTPKEQKLGIEQLIREIKILSRIGSHKHVVELIGACTKNIEAGNLIMFLELCELGPLDRFLREHHRMLESPYKFLNPNSRLSTDDELSWQLKQWAFEIATGLEFISSKKVIHMDIALRNILLTSDLTSKISDFGMSQVLLTGDNLPLPKDMPVPFRWLAPETIHNNMVSFKSDVWAFGITLWEMYSLGEKPYATITDYDNFFRNLDNGDRLAKPDFADEHMYNIMLQCWEYESIERPTFGQILHWLAKPRILHDINTTGYTVLPCFSKESNDQEEDSESETDVQLELEQLQNLQYNQPYIKIQ